MRLRERETETKRENKKKRGEGAGEGEGEGARGGGGGEGQNCLPPVHPVRPIVAVLEECHVTVNNTTIFKIDKEDARFRFQNMSKASASKSNQQNV